MSKMIAEPVNCTQCGAEIKTVLQEFRGDFCKKCDDAIGMSLYAALCGKNGDKIARVMGGDRPDDRKVTSARY